MSEAWEILVAAGVPDGAIRPAASAPDADLVRFAFEATAATLDELSLRDRELLFSWLSAFRHHFASAFRETLGEAGERVFRALERDAFDPNRYLKLRRIAIENLAASALRARSDSGGEAVEVLPQRLDGQGDP